MKPSTRSSLPHCLFCSEVCTTPATPQLEGGMEVHCASLQKHLLQFFILPQLLDIPLEWCAQSLQAVDENGDPGSWFRVCSDCLGKWVDDAWRTHQKIVKLESKMRSIRESIKERMMKSVKRKPGRRKYAQMGVEDRIKSFIFPDLMELTVPEDDDILKVEDMELLKVKVEQPSDDFTWDNDNKFILQDFHNEVTDDDFVLPPPKRTRETTQRRKLKIKSKKGRRKRGKAKPTESRVKEEPSELSPYWKYCKQCSAKFTDSEELESHLVAHEASKKTGGKYDCKICKFPAMNDTELEVHTNHRHTNKREVKTYSCPQCDFSSITWKTLKEHFREKHPEIPEDEVAVFQLKCNVCQREFTKLKSMMVHKKNRHPELFGVQQEAIPCEQCSLIFPSRILLKYHINTTHLRVSKFFCDRCGKGFRFMRLLERHKIIHQKETREREFVCQYCGMDYHYKSQMNNHILKFHPEVGKGKKKQSADSTSSANQEELSCKYCAMKTPYKPVMMRHMEIHKAEMGHQCDICNKYYTNDQSLKRHKRINHPITNEVVNCPHCNKPFTNVDYMKTHESKYCKLKHLKIKSQEENSVIEAQSDPLI